jgi:hypothetical protein
MADYHVKSFEMPAYVIERVMKKARGPQRG